MTENAPSEIALAFSRRWEHEQSLRRRLYTSLVGLKETPEDADSNSKSISHRAKRADDLLSARDNSERKMEIEREYANETFFSFTENAIRKQSPNFRITRTKAIQELVHYYISESLDDNLLLKYSDFTIRQFDAAREMAMDEDINPETIFQNASLFEENVKESINPWKYVELLLPWQQANISDSQADFAANLVARIFTTDKALKLITGQGRGQLLRGIPVKHVFSQIIKRQLPPIEKRREATSKVILLELERFWGPDGINDLLPEQYQMIFN